ncbi:zinc-binding alcohol dehydrogenase family protein [Actinoplanes sp. LDG1-06]|uniref:Zinc-binding alcohol dehydrogenase family protein n=1 Tax=Paractinoplanes ovalisporus TaxID=2810368 RepID=A0ABS2ATP8_9ACTN|nr:zinc-binding alcohol dehydrogenase family protein [Actinoplanes ovalisporus]MBM2623250.1 zinc-binding alcohol dehydrogenase family protein [Actinoplanes ovalisporus]
MKIHAAVVSSFDRPPAYEPFDLPDFEGGDDLAVADVLAVGLHPRVRSGASGRHYTSTGKLPMVPGVDGVGRLADGRTVYFVADDDLTGPMATRTVIDTRRSVDLPAGADPVMIAAAMNPAMSSWVALRRRVPLRAGQSVLVLGAGGNAGGMAMRVASLLGAGRVVGAARRPSGPDVVALSDVASVAAEADVVLDYLWGAPAAEAMMAILRARPDRGRELNWIQIGSVAGPTIELPSVALRSANFRLLGNGQGAVSARAYLAELPSLIDEITAGRLSLKTRTVPLADVEAAWTTPEQPGVRTVLVP